MQLFDDVSARLEDLCLNQGNKNLHNHVIGNLSD